MAPIRTGPDDAAAQRLLDDARRLRDERARGYREQAFKLFPPICGRCGREHSGKRLRELTVHHKDGNHDNNPPDGSNWELLCVYCHDNEHGSTYEYSQRADSGRPRDTTPPLTHKPFEKLAALMEAMKKKES